MLLKTYIPSTIRAGQGHSLLGSFLLFSMSIETNTSSNGTNFLCFRNDAFGEKHEARQPLFYSPNFFTFSVSGYRSIAPRVCQFRSENHCLKPHLGSLSRNRFLRSFDRRIPTDKTLYVYRPMHSARCRKRQKIKKSED